MVDIKTKPDFKYLLFDLDGTLTDPYEGITKSFQYALAAYGIEAAQEDLTFVIGPPLINCFCDVYGFDMEKGEEAVAKYRERFSRVGWRENRLLDGVQEMLLLLKERGKVISLATSKPYAFAKKIIEEFDIAKYFDVVIGAEFDGSLGTKEQIIKKALSELGVEDLSSVVMIGDRKHDIIGAKKCGVKSIGVRVGYAQENELEDVGADYIIDTIEELTEFLL